MKDENLNLRVNMIKTRLYGRVSTSSWKREMKPSNKKFQRRIKSWRRQLLNCRRNLLINKIINSRLRFLSFMTHSIRRRLLKCKMLTSNTLKSCKKRTEFYNQTTILCLKSMKLFQETKIKTSALPNEKFKSSSKVRRSFKKRSNSWNKNETDEWMIIILNLKRNEKSTNRSCLKLTVKLEKQIKREIPKCLSLRRRRPSILWKLIIWLVSFKNQMKMCKGSNVNLKIWTRKMSVSRLKLEQTRKRSTQVAIILPHPLI